MPQSTTKYSPEVVARITDAIALGATRTMACKYGGIDIDTLANWERRHPAFVAAMQEAEGRAVIGWLAKIEQAANEGTWQAAAWKLERRYPEDYGRTVHDQRHSGSIRTIADLLTSPDPEPEGSLPPEGG